MPSYLSSMNYGYLAIQYFLIVRTGVGNTVYQFSNFIRGFEGLTSIIALNDISATLLSLWSF